jgi:hypothetical protein
MHFFHLHSPSPLRGVDIFWDMMMKKSISVGAGSPKSVTPTNNRQKPAPAHDIDINLTADERR